jgi:hypothetical protein
MGLLSATYEDRFAARTGSDHHPFSERFSGPIVETPSINAALLFCADFRLAIRTIDDESCHDASVKWCGR